MIPEGEIREFRRHQTVFEESELPEFVYRLESGLVKIVRTVEKSMSLARIVRPGEYFDERVLFDRSPRRTRAMAVCDARVRVWHVSGLEANCEVWRALMAQGVRRAEEAEERAGRLAKLTVEQRLAHFLAGIMPARKAGGEPATVPLSQKELADLVGATRESTCAAIRSLSKRGLVLSGRATVTIPCPERLRRM